MVGELALVGKKEKRTRTVLWIGLGFRGLLCERIPAYLKMSFAGWAGGTP
jgi:hypothetical protein